PSQFTRCHTAQSFVFVTTVRLNRTTPISDMRLVELAGPPGSLENGGDFGVITSGTPFLNFIFPFVYRAEGAMDFA
ncbi:MAG: hypothetical protein ACYDBJ_19055, partial [Aggregatilineales bacterium]